MRLTVPEESNPIIGTRWILIHSSILNRYKNFLPYMITGLAFKGPDGVILAFANFKRKWLSDEEIQVIDRSPA